MKTTIVVVAALAAGCLGPPLVLPDPQAESAAPAARTPAERTGPPAHAFEITRASDLLSGPAADGRVGDYRLDNGRMTVIVSAPARVLGFAQSGGNILDAAPTGGEDALRQIYGYLGDSFPRQPVYDRVEALEDNGTGIIVARGHDSDDPRIRVETRYSLAPGSDALAIDTTLTNGGDRALEHFGVGDAIEWGRSELFVPGHGIDATGHLAADPGWVEAIADNAAYAYVGVQGALIGHHGWAWSDLNASFVSELSPGAAIRVSRWLVVERPSDASRYETIAGLRNQHWARLSGRILTDGRTSLPDARVFFDDRDGPFAMVRSSVRGYDVRLPPGDYHVRAVAAGRSAPERLDVTVSESGGATHDVLLSKRGTLAFQVRDGGTALPAKLTVFGVAPTPDPRLGAAFASPGGNIIVSATGEGDLALPPGRYRVIASSGLLYGIDEQTVDVPGGDRAQVTFNLQRAIDGFGWRCLDPHQHAFPSSDSAVRLADRAASNLAEGLEVLVATDHNAVADDWAQAIAGLHAARPLPLIVGDEITLERLGDFSVIPFAAADPALRQVNELVHKKPALADLVRTVKSPDRLLILNHPRGQRIGYFDNIGFDPRTADLKQVVAGFDALEVFSGKDPSKVEPVLRDWMALLDRGITLTAVGGSDTHLIYGQEVGSPRTCVQPDEHGQLSATGFVAAIKKRREALVTNGPFVRISVAGHGMGRIAPAPRGRARIDVEIEAAPWVDVRRLELFVNGTRRGKAIDIPASTAPLRYKASVDLRVERDAYVIAVVRGDQGLAPVVAPDGQTTPTALAITNPIYLDRDGDGRYTPPNADAAGRSR